MAKKVVRLYHLLSDDDMLQKAETMQGIFEDDKAAFITHDAGFSDPYAADWLAKIEKAYNYGTDQSFRNSIKVCKEDVAKCWEDCRDSFREARYFIKKAFPRNAAMRKAFGFKDFYIMNVKKGNVVMFMEIFHLMAEEYSAALIANGYTQAKIDAIETITDAFEDAERKMYAKKKQRTPTAEGRIILLNEVWEIVQLVNKASKEVYKNDFAKRKQYLLPE